MPILCDKAFIDHYHGIADSMCSSNEYLAVIRGIRLVLDQHKESDFQIPEIIQAIYIANVEVMISTIGKLADNNPKSWSIPSLGEKLLIHCSSSPSLHNLYNITQDLPNNIFKLNEVIKWRNKYVDHLDKMSKTELFKETYKLSIDDFERCVDDFNALLNKIANECFSYNALFSRESISVLHRQAALITEFAIESMC